MNRLLKKKQPLNCQIILQIKYKMITMMMKMI